MQVPPVHGVPSGFGVTLPQPVAGVQVAAVLHSSPAAQVTALPAVHAPDWHVSPLVQALPSLHVVPSLAAGFEHMPSAGLHVPATWHESLAVQTFAVPPQVPLVQTSLVVHRLPSLHVVPSVAAGFEHMPVAGLQAPATWH